MLYALLVFLLLESFLAWRFGHHAPTALRAARRDGLAAPTSWPTDSASNRARAGEAIAPSIRFEQPWPQWVTLLVVLGSLGAVVWLYRREGRASLPTGSAWPRSGSCLVLLAVFMLSEAVLSVERTGLPYFVVMVDDSASQQVADQYDNPKAKAAAEELAKASGRPEAIALGGRRGAAR